MTASPLKPQANRYWTTLGVFPKGLETRDKAEERRNQTLRTLSQLGLGNLRLLFERWKLQRSDEDRADQLAKVLVDLTSDGTLLCLREFHRSRIQFIEEVFEASFTERERKQIEAAIDQLSNRPEGLRSFTKLLLLYEKDPSLLSEAFTLAGWRSRPTVFEFQSKNKWPKNLTQKLTAPVQIKELEKALGKAVSKKRVRFESALPLRDGTQVFLFHREYYPTIKRDFEREFNLHHPCGHVLFGVNEAGRRLEVRTAHSKVANAIRGWFQNLSKADLILTKELTFSDYDPEAVVNAFLGAYPEDCGIEIVSATFLRSGLPLHSSLTVRSVDDRSSIRQDLEALKEKEVLRPHSLTDLAECSLSFGGMSARVILETDTGGALRLSFDNAGWNSTIQRNFEAAFRKCFGVPLNQLIDPSKLALGKIGIIGHLLTARRANDVFAYQQPALEELLEGGILIAKSREGRLCTSSRCDLFNTPLVETDRADCQKCGTRLRETSVIEYYRNEKLLAERLGDLFKEADGSTLSERDKSFEGLPYRALENDNEEALAPIIVLLNEFISEKTKARYQRSLRPILIVRSKVEAPYALVDQHGVGQISMAYILTAAESDDTRNGCLDVIKKLLEDLRRDNASRVAAAARRSYQTLISRPAGYTDNEYETDIFNLLKWLFPETIRLGRTGRIEPDGLSGFPIPEVDNAYEADLWTWTYDAKLTASATSYDLNIGECRKILNYITKLRRSKPLLKKSARLRGHVLISNRISEDQLKKAHSFLFGKDGLPEEHRNVALVCMMEDFLVRLYQKVSSHENDFRRRAPHFFKECVELFSPAPTQGYRKLVAADADKLVKEVLSSDPVHPEIKEKQLVKSLEKD